MKTSFPQLCIFSCSMLCLLLLAGCAPIEDTPPLQHLDAAPKSNATTYYYTCTGIDFVAQVQREQAWLFTPESSFSLPRTPAASGNRYHNRDRTYWNHGDEALLVLGETEYKNCRNTPNKIVWEAAQKRGVTFKAIGNEPGWSLEFFDTDEITFIGNYGETIINFTEPPSSQKTKQQTTYTMTEPVELSVIITNTACSDTMTGQTFTNSVRLLFADSELQGCGKKLVQPE